MQVDSTFSPTHLRERRESVTPVPIYASAVIIVYAKSSCHTLQCPSSLSLCLFYLSHSVSLSASFWLSRTRKHTRRHTQTHTRTLESQWFSFCESELSEGTVWAFVKTELQRQRNSFPTAAKKEKKKPFQESHIVPAVF